MEIPDPDYITNAAEYHDVFWNGIHYGDDDTECEEYTESQFCDEDKVIKEE